MVETERRGTEYPFRRSKTNEVFNTNSNLLLRRSMDTYPKSIFKDPSEVRRLSEQDDKCVVVPSDEALRTLIGFVNHIT